MSVEISVSSAHAKAQALRVLREQGHDALSGPVRLAYPFAILVSDVDESGAATIVHLVSRLDPTAGLIVGAGTSTG